MSGKEPHGERVKPAGQALNPGDEAAPGTPGTGEDICRTCKGTGRLNGAQCPDCAGSGVVIEGIGGA